MKFTIDKKLLFEALQKVQSIIEKKNTQPILLNVLIEISGKTLHLTANDLEVGVKITMKVDKTEDENVTEDGKVTISAKNLFDIIKELPDKPVTFNKMDNNWIQIICHKTKYNMAGLAADEFPPIPSFEEKKFIQVNSTAAKEMIDKTLFAVSTDETRYHLNGAYFESIENKLIRMVATDGHRLAFIDKELVLDSTDIFKNGVIIPKKGLNELRKILDENTETFQMTVDRGNLLVQFEKIQLFIRLIEGDYPDYEQVIPKDNNKKILINREDLIGSLKRMIPLSNEKSRNVKFSLTDGLLTISTSNTDLGDAKEEIDVDYKGDGVEIGFNARYIIECLSANDAQKISFELNDKLSPGIIRPVSKSDYTYVIMPMRVQ